MNDNDNMASFIKENGRLAKEWADAKMELYRLQAIKAVAKSASYIIWIMIVLFLLFLFIIFCGITAGFWISSELGSYTAGFGIVTTILILIVLPFVGLCKRIFVNPIIRELTGSNKRAPGELSE